jgi:TRAP-type C4-dicarboxylate transport system permease small subunit
LIQTIIYQNIQVSVPNLVAILDRSLAIVAGLLAITLLAVVTAGILSRAANMPFVWTDEISGYLMVWLACFGWMIATRRGSHIRIQNFQNRLPAPAWLVLERAFQLAMMALGAIIAWKSIHLIQVNSDVEAVTLPVPTALLYVPLLPAGLLTFGQAFAELLRPRAPTDVTGAKLL